LEVKIKKVRLTWPILFSFLIGTIVGCISPDPTDWVFFLSNQQGWLVDNPWFQVFTWYALTASLYFAIFVISVVMWKKKLGTPYVIVWSIMAMTIASALITIRTMSSEMSGTSIVVFTVVMTILVTVSLAYVMGYRTHLKVGGKTYV